MANHIGDVPVWLDEIYMEKTLQQYFKNDRFVVKKCDITAGSSVGDNYLCQIFRIKLVVNQGDENDETLSIIGKFNPETKFYQKLAEKFFDLHKAEETFYSETLPDLQKIVSEKSDKILGPEFYLFDSERKIIFIEDIKVKGFLLKPRSDFLDFEHCLKLVEMHATLHAASYLLLQKQPKLKKEYSRYIWQKELSSMDEHFINNTLTALTENMSKWDLTEKQSSLLLKIKDNINSTGLEICEYNENNFNVLLHGDCWKNNLMFQYENNEVKDIRLIDFQLVNYNSFAIDLQYSLSSSATREARFERIDELLEHYFESFCKIAPNVPGFTFDFVKAEFKKKNYLGFCMATFMRPMVVAVNGMDMDSIMDGKTDTSPYESEIFAKEIKSILDYFHDVYD